MSQIFAMYNTLMPVILAGVLNMKFCRSDVLKGLQTPMDGGYRLADGKQLLGPNKTWKGFFGMIILTALCQLIWTGINQRFPLMAAHHYLFPTYGYEFVFNLQLGAAFGFAYVLFELPNSFLKRRLGIAAGKLAEPDANFKRLFFLLLDQIDSLLGCVWLLHLLQPLSWQEWLTFLALGAGTHLLINQLLYRLNLRDNPN